MTVFWTIGAIALAIIVVVSIVDVFRHHYSGGATVGWIALIVLLPFIGAIVYWSMRKPSQEEIDQAMLGQAEMRRSAASRPFDSTGL
jgi:hypothetical protein